MNKKTFAALMVGSFSLSGAFAQNAVGTFDKVETSSLKVSDDIYPDVATLSSTTLNVSYVDAHNITLHSQEQNSNSDYPYLRFKAESDGTDPVWNISCGGESRGGSYLLPLVFNAGSFAFNGGQTTFEEDVTMNSRIFVKGRSFFYDDLAIKGGDIVSDALTTNHLAGGYTVFGRPFYIKSQASQATEAPKFFFIMDEDDNAVLKNESGAQTKTLHPVVVQSSNFDVQSTMSVGGNTTIDGDLTVTGTLKAANLAFDGVSTEAVSAGYANLTGNLTVGGSSEFNNSIFSYAPIVMYAKDVEGAIVGRMGIGSEFNESSVFQGWNIEAKQSYPTQAVYYPLNFSAKEFSFANGDVKVENGLNVAGKASFDDVDVAGELSVKGNMAVDELKSNRIAVMGTGCASNSVAEVFEITGDGEIEASKRFTLFEKKATCQPVHPAFNVQAGYDEENILNSWDISTAYTTPGGGVVKNDLNFEASAFNFNGGDMVVNGKLTCKDQFKVAEVETGTLRARDITVDLNNAADYVFDENYELKSLGEVEAYVKANKHLPGIPSASEIKDNGMNVSEMSNLLLEKIEELTLHLIRVEKENQALKAEVESLKK